MVLGTLRISENTGILMFMDRYTLLLYDNNICNESKDDLRWIKNICQMRSVLIKITKHGSKSRT